MKFSSDNKLISIAVTLTKRALENLSHGTFTELVLALLPEAVGEKAFNHVFLGFSHSGHQLVGIYDVAQFDMHFVIQPLAEKNAISAYYSSATTTKFDNLPVASSIHLPYFRIPMAVLLMGVHWAKSTSHEFNGSRFIEIFMMGFYDGKMTFYEPMVTLALLNSKPNITKSAHVPIKFN